MWGVVGKDGISLGPEVMEVVLRQGALQKYLPSPNAGRVPEMEGGPASVPAGPAFLQGLLPLGPSDGRTSLDGVSATARRSFQRAGPSLGHLAWVCVHVSLSVCLYVSTMPTSISATSPMPGSRIPQQLRGLWS